MSLNFLTVVPGIVWYHHRAFIKELSKVHWGR
jgi:hypothetical protein